MNELTMIIDEEVNADNKDRTGLDTQVKSIPGGSGRRFRQYGRRKSGSTTVHVIYRQPRSAQELARD